MIKYKLRASRLPKVYSCHIWSAFKFKWKHIHIWECAYNAWLENTVVRFLYLEFLSSYLNFIFFINVKYKISSFSFINALSRYLFSKCAQFLSFHLSSLHIHVILLFNLHVQLADKNICSYIKKTFPFESSSTVLFHFRNN